MNYILENMLISLYGKYFKYGCRCIINILILKPNLALDIGAKE